MEERETFLCGFCRQEHSIEDPFPGRAGKTSFALAHNGMLHNDKALRTDLHLPPTAIETDSYAAVQLIERDGTMDFGSLKHMAEVLRGSFTITVLDDKNGLYIVRGNNPMCIYHFKGAGLTSGCLLNISKKDLVLQRLH